MYELRNPSMADTLGSIKRYVSVGVCIQTNTQLLNVNAANLHRFPEVLGRSRRGTTFPSTRPALSPWCPVLTPANPTERGWSLNRKWVGQSDFAWFCGPPSNRTPEGWFARCDSSVHCRPLAARGVLLLILQFLSFSICFFFVLTYLLKRIKYKLIDK